MESSFCCRDGGGKAVGSVERRRGSREYPTVLDSKTRMSFGCFDVESAMLILFEKVGLLYGDYGDLEVFSFRFRRSL